MARCAVVFLAVLAFAFAAQAFEVVIDGKSEGKVFEGIGALSAGASSRLLMEYPEAQRGEILDFLFKPGYGASFHHLKVEIGGDINSTDGVEPSFARTREEWEHPRAEYFDRGYEWWLMREAKKRNPAILLDILQWGAPEWIGAEAVEDDPDPEGLPSEAVKRRNQKKFYTQDNADYIVAFIKGAKEHHNLDIDFCGIWNEMPYDTGWIKLLRRTLDRANLDRVRIIAADQCTRKPWEIAKSMLEDEALMDAVHAIGGHYPGMLRIEEEPALLYNAIPAAKQTGKPLWSSEDGPWKGDWEHGARQLAMMFNRNHIVGGMSKTIIWSLITSYYDNLPLPGSGPMLANTPWSGHYEVQPALWAIAHTTQFVQPGWRYLERSCGMLAEGGSYVSLRNRDDGEEFSIIVETMEAKKEQPVVWKLEGGLRTDAFRVWRSNKDSQFDRLEDLTAHWGNFEMVLEPECIYSLTTTAGQEKGFTTPPEPAAFPIPYKDDFDATGPGKMARHFSDQGGIFEVMKIAEEKGNCLRQCIDRKGIEWTAHLTPEPYTVIGSTVWDNFTVACDVMVEAVGYAALYGRVGKCPQSADAPEGYCFRLYDDGAWKLLAVDKELASGRVELGKNPWHNMAMRFAGSKITLAVDGTEVTTGEDNTFAAGMAGLGTGWNCARFDNFAVRSPAAQK
jgi:galactosylceramidase